MAVGVRCNITGVVTVICKVLKVPRRERKRERGRERGLL